ncbi:MAG: acetoacetate decarboxylase family protein [Anaerolineae bacterium]|nr:acetoacetate decarboxylase family protein [Anaerolineae bacterium]
MDLDGVPILNKLVPDLCASAQLRRAAAGEVLFYAGDPTHTLYLLRSGRIGLALGSDPRGEAQPGDLLDLEAVLGGPAHSVKATALEDCELLGWEVEALWRSEAFAAEARRHLAAALRAARARIDALESAARVQYCEPGAGLLPGPYLFEDATMVFAFCDADLDAVCALLPPGLSLLRAPGAAAPALLALADFPIAHPIDNPGARMAPYAETTCFVPVRFGTAVGLYVPYIYPSAWEPILLGREIYGFPKRLGETTLTAKSASLVVAGEQHINLSWRRAEPSSEASLVGALMDILGLQKHAAALAFRAGEVLRRAMRLPGYRRVDVYNHKRALAAGATYDDLTCAIDCLTRATFGVLRWHQVAEARAPVLEVTSGPLADAGLSLRAVYRTRLDLRLGAGRVVRDYLTTNDTGKHE